MATTKTRRKSNGRPGTALMFNPASGLSVSGRRKTAARKSNPTARTRAVVNPRKRRTRRRRNPAGSSFSLMRNPAGTVLLGAMAAGIGYSGINSLLSRFMPGGTPIVQAIFNFGVGAAIQALGGRAPFGLGKYKDPVAFVFYALGFAGLANYYIWPSVTSTFNSLSGQALSLLNPAVLPAGTVVAPATTMAGVRRARY